MISIHFLLLGTTLCLLLEAFFSGSELALVAADKVKLAHRAAKGERGAQMALFLAHRPELFFSTTLLGQNLFIVANSILVTFFIFQKFGPQYEILGLLLSPIVLIFGEAVPKAYAQHRADTITPLVSPVILTISYIFYPIVWPLSGLTLLLMGGVRGSLVLGHEVTHESLEAMLNQSEAPRHLSPVFKKSLLKILSFARNQVHEIMTPLTEVASLSQSASIRDAIRLCRTEGYSSLPVYEKKSYNIVGLVTYLQLLLAPDLEAPLADIMETSLYVPHFMGVKEIFLLLREKRKSFAVVIDEYGGATGVVTLEDILEEIVGEIEDEFDYEKPLWTQISPNQFLFQGRVTINEINEKLHWSLPEEGYETLAGFLMSQFGKVPQSGDTLPYSNLTFLIKTATARTIDEVLVEIGA